jgi:hypothetical protein
VASSIKVGDVREALKARAYPTVTTFNRLEGRPRTVQFDRALRAEVRDPLWMLTKQWQMGEFRGSDAGSPITARLVLQRTQLTKYRPDSQAAEPFPSNIPLETKVERRTLALERAKRPIALDLRLLMGRYWLQLIASLPNRYEDFFVATYGIAKPDPADPLQSDPCAHLEAWQTYEAAAGRAMDGGGLYTYLTQPGGHHAYDGITIVPGDEGPLDDRATRFVAWAERLISVPPAASDDAWVPERLEYQFSVSATGADGAEVVYVADEYSQGYLDWYSLDVDSKAEPLGDVPDAPSSANEKIVRTMLPVPVTFAGMAHSRWWTFEDGVTNFGDVDAATTDLGKLLFLEFALVYANDWFLVPCTLPIGCIASPVGVAVTNVFGERQWIAAAGSNAAARWQRWSLYNCRVRGNPKVTSDPSLLLLPTVPHIQEGDVLEDILLIRDESANMVWGVERTVTLSTGEPKRGLEISREAADYFLRVLNAGTTGGPPPAAAPIRYQLMSNVPENWIPFIPARVSASDNREIQLQRAAMPRMVGTLPTADLPADLRKVEPRTRLLREGLDRDPASSYLVHEEAVPRAGVHMNHRYQRTRWVDGAAPVWLRVKKETGRGEGSSGLRFDQLSTPAPEKSKA